VRNSHPTRDATQGKFITMGCGGNCECLSEGKGGRLGGKDVLGKKKRGKKEIVGQWKGSN